MTMMNFHPPHMFLIMTNNNAFPPRKASWSSSSTSKQSQASPTYIFLTKATDQNNTEMIAVGQDAMFIGCLFSSCLIGIFELKYL